MKSIPNKVILTTLIIASILCACDNKETENPIPLVDSTITEKFIEASQGGTLSTSEKIELIIPPNALLESGEVFLGRTGEEPASVPNQNVQVIGVSFTVKLPGDSIAKPLIVSFPEPALDVVQNLKVFRNNGSTCCPFEYSI